MRCVVLNASLKKFPEESNTEGLAEMLANELATYACTTEVIRLSELSIDHGVGLREGAMDEWPGVAKAIQAADAVVFATPIWWGAASSYMQKVMERMDWFDEEYIRTGKNALYNKVAAVLVTGAEDGAFQIMSHLMGTLTWMGFSFPPEAGAYWTGEVGQEQDDREFILSRDPVKRMVRRCAHNLAHMSGLLKSVPLTELKDE